MPSKQKVEPEASPAVAKNLVVQEEILKHFEASLYQSPEQKEMLSKWKDDVGSWKGIMYAFKLTRQSSMLKHTGILIKRSSDNWVRIDWGYGVTCGSSLWKERKYPKERQYGTRFLESETLSSFEDEVDREEIGGALQDEAQWRALLDQLRPDQQYVVATNNCRDWTKRVIDNCFDAKTQASVMLSNTSMHDFLIFLTMGVLFFVVWVVNRCLKPAPKRR